MTITVTAGFAGRVSVVGLVFAASIGTSGCVSTRLKIDDLAFVSMRRVDARERAAHPDAVPLHMTNKVYEDVEFVEVTLSTSVDLVGEVRSNPNWAPYSRKWQCQLGWDDGWMDSRFEDVYVGGKRVAPPPSKGRLDSRPVAASGVSKAGRYSYAIYFAVEDEQSGRATRYDLLKSPTDVCVEFAESGYYNTTSLQSNVVTIPADAFRQLFSDTLR